MIINIKYIIQTFENNVSSLALRKDGHYLIIIAKIHLTSKINIQ